MDFDIRNNTERKIRCVRNDDISWFQCRHNADKLTPGEIYTVTDVDIHSWHTEIYLAEIPGVAFNSVLFEEIEQGA